MTLFRQFIFSIAALGAVLLIGGNGPVLAQNTAVAGSYQVAQATLTPEERAARKKKRQELRKAKKRKKEEAKRLKREERKKKKAAERKRKKAAGQDPAAQKRKDAENKKAAEARKAAARKKANAAKKAADAKKAAARKKANDAKKAADAKKKKKQKNNNTTQQEQAGDPSAKSKDRKKRLKAKQQEDQQRATKKATAPSLATPLRSTAEQRTKAERKQRRLRKVREERRKAEVLSATASAKQRERRKKRRLDLQVVITGDGVLASVSTRRTLRERRLERQRNWERQQARRDRRQLRRDFGFHRRARPIRRRNDRIIYAGLALAAVGAATGGGLYVYYDDDARFGRRARDVRVEPLRNGWTRTVVVRPNGARIVTIRDARGFIVRRYRVRPNNQVTFFYNNQPSWWDDADLHVEIAPVSVGIPRDRYIVEPSYAPVETIYETVTAPPVDELDRTYTLNQILMNDRLRDYMPRIDLDAISFAPGSAQVPPSQFDKLDAIGVAMEQAIKENPDEVYLIEGHTDATGSDETNLELSDRRAAAVGSALTDNFEIPPENLVTQGYGEQFLKVDTPGPSQPNRRVAIRRITPLLSREHEQVAFDDKGNEIFEPEGAGQ